MPAIGQFLGSSAGLSAPVISRLAETWKAGQHALAAVKAFEAACGAKSPKAVAKITDDLDELPAFYERPEPAAA